MGDSDRNGPKRKRAKTDFEDIMTLDEWGEEFNEQLEEVCIIAESSQLPLNITRSNGTFSVLNEDKRRIPETSKPFETLSRVDEEKQRLREALKTKEGEVAILRAKLKNDALQQKQKENEITEKQKAEIAELKKTVQALQGELEFKNLEVKGLSDSVKQLEIRSPKVRFIERPTIDVEQNRFSLSQSISKPTKEVKIIECKKEEKKFVVARLGEKFSKLIVPEFFKNLEEKSVVLMYDTSPDSRDGLDHLRHDKFKWTGLPTVCPKLSLLYPHVLELKKHGVNYFSACTKILEITKEILLSLKNVLIYLSGLRIDIKKEEALVSDTSCGDPLSLKELLSDRLLKPEERGIESRRSLAICACVLSVYREAVVKYSSKDMLELLEEIVKLIGKIMRPIEFSGVLAGILMYLQSLFSARDKTPPLPDESLLLIKTITEAVIFCRPKLDVLTQVVATFRAASYNPIFHNLCRKSPPDSCALYMDAKLKQAIFFNADACPLKLLQVQIKTLAHLSGNRKLLMDVTSNFTSWYHCVLANAEETPDWLLRENEKCCDITECYSHLLTLVIRDAKTDLSCRNVIEKGVVVLKEATKKNQKKHRCDTLKLLPFSLKSSGLLEAMRKVPKEYVEWLIAEYDAQMSNQESIVWSKGSASSD